MWYLAQDRFSSFSRVPKRGNTLNHKDFSFFREELQKTQKQMGELLGTSLRAIQSFEQGWRKVPVHIERQVLFLISNKQGIPRNSRACWDIRDCSPENREGCPSWEFNVEGMCWFINGTFCQGKAQGSWVKKMKVCRACEVFSQTMEIRDFGQKGRANIQPGPQRGERKMVNHRMSLDEKFKRTSLKEGKVGIR